ncbi:DUF3954 domain-containing protein [Metabacillus bambusae]|uniref:DUF3954 domain-containing protein n=1 Tax=Metabacillus bambusae TaxID=2795218 RepID=A0ABS3NAF9_9BACI|nr:DUF3954 domain-containing protein [Metabacillus bambusae]MBO1515036.1 DUF3954 domain-containing protein [Metabacillus bambusae]
MKTNINKMTVEIDLMKNATYIVKDGEIKVVPTPAAGYGKQIINWQGGKPCHGKLETDIKF